ncbi:hypothetical protein FKM82_022287 [Ascaphus truei]
MSQNAYGDSLLQSPDCKIGSEQNCITIFINPKWNDFPLTHHFCTAIAPILQTGAEHDAVNTFTAERDQLIHSLMPCLGRATSPSVIEGLQGPSPPPSLTGEPLNNCPLDLCVVKEMC